MALFEMETSCNAEKSCCSKGKDTEEKGCCGGENCNCTCCVHLVYLDFQEEIESFPSIEFHDIIYTYQFTYEFDWNKGMFHPPLNV